MEKYNVTYSKIRIKKNKIHIKINNELVYKHKIELLLINRKDNLNFIKAKLIKKTNKYLYFVFILDKNIITNLYYDFYFQSLETSSGVVKLEKVKKFSNIQAYNLNLFRKKQTTVAFDEFSPVYHLSIYFARGGGLALQTRELDIYDGFWYKMKTVAALMMFPFVYWFYKDRKVTYEKFSNYARDNSYYYFCYVQENIKNNKLYFILKEDSPDFSKLEKYKSHRVKFMSIEHLLLILSARYLVASESKGHCYAWRHNQGIIRYILNRKVFVFLQHGVLGLKKLDNTFLKSNRLNRASLFMASSNLEKKIIMNELGYEEKQIAITGLSRWDSNNFLEKENKIFIMPTWRIELESLNMEEFKKTRFYEEYSKLLRCAELVEALEKEKFTIHLMIHPKLLKFEKLFFSNKQIKSQIKFKLYDKITIEREIKTSKLIITDYSSIVWDSLMYQTPVLLFQFDQEDYLKNQGAYLNFEEIFSNLIVKDTASLVEEILKFLTEYDYEIMKESLEKYKKKYFLYTDKNNSDRVHKAIEKWESKFHFNSLIDIFIKRIF